MGRFLDRSEKNSNGPRSGYHTGECNGTQLFVARHALRVTPFERELSAGARSGDNWPSAGAAYGSAAGAAAARCGAARRNCRISPVARPAHAASALARNIPDSNTAPSNREDIASSRLAVSMGRRQEGNQTGRPACPAEMPRQTGGILRSGVLCVKGNVRN